MKPSPKKEDDFSEFEAMRENQISPEMVCRRGIERGLEPIEMIRMLRFVFPLSLGEAKEVAICAEEGVGYLAEYQERWVAELEKFFRMEDGDQE